MTTNTELMFKGLIMDAILEQGMVTDIDEQIKFLKDICADLKQEYKKQLKGRDSK